MTADPIGQAGGINLYPYANSNPLTYIDPTGENPIVKQIIKKLLKDSRKSKKTKKGANKKDRKQVGDAARDAGIPKDRRRDFGDFLEKIKREEGRGGRDNFDFDELRDLAKEFKDTQCR